MKSYFFTDLHQLYEIFSLYRACFCFIKTGDAAQQNDLLQVKTKNGILQGAVEHNNGIRSFKGIPYAQPPVRQITLAGTSTR